MKSEFDDVAENYETEMNNSVGVFGKDISYYAMYKVLLIKEYAKINPRNILEFGCGTGRNLPFLKEYFPTSKIFGFDPSVESIKIAKQNDQVKFLEKEELQNFQFDLIFIAGVFHHIPPEDRLNTMEFIKPLLSSLGEIFVFEHNPYNPLTRRAVNTCPFDKGVNLLKAAEVSHYLKEAGFGNIDKQYCLFFPAGLKMFRTLERFLKLLPLGGQYFVKAGLS